MEESRRRATTVDRSPDRIYCIYENQPLSARSTHAVPRLLAQLIESLASAKVASEFVTISPGGGDVKGARNIAADLSLPAKVWARIRCSHWLSTIFGREDPESTVSYHRAHSALQPLRAEATERTMVICATMSAAMLARRELPTSRVVYWVQGMPRLGQEAMASRAVAVVDAIVAPSKAIYNDLFQLICRDRFAPPVWVIPNAIDTEQFLGVASERRSEVRAKLNIDPQATAIMHIGRAPEKGLQVVKAALAVAGIQQPVVLISAGGQEKSRTQISDQVEIIEIGRVSPEELNEVYQICDVGVVPSVWWENCPLALIEMMSLGLCVIGSRVGGIPEMIDHGENGLLVDAPNDVNAWAAAINAVLTDSDLRQRFATAARQAAAHKFNQREIHLQWERFVGTVASLA